ncbi:uncharacterized protein [Watersipora subatra]|uniref:uncharacterized protein n=1 Tax=Watersipora subatra TaxID=2589382 RepID=UPI00355ADAF4
MASSSLKNSPSLFTSKSTPSISNTEVEDDHDSDQDIMVAATLVTMDETRGAIQEAFSIGKKWNPAWDRQLKRRDNEIGEERQIILASPRKIAQSSIQELILVHLVVFFIFQNGAVCVIKAALEGWANWWANSKSLKIQEYFLNQWMSEDMPKKRMECYRHDRFLFSVRTNNGIEHINKRFKQNFSHYKTNNGLTRVLHIIVTHFTHFLFDRYSAHVEGLMTTSIWARLQRDDIVWQLQ